MNAKLTVADGPRTIAFSFEDLLDYHGYEFPGGVAHAFKVMELAFPLLEPSGAVRRRDVRIRTPFKGPGARDAFEMVTRAVTGGRYIVDETLSQADRGSILAPYFFELSYGEALLALRIKPGHVREEFIALGRKADRTPEEEERLVFLKQEMADRLLSLAPGDVYEVAP